jgi:hypothetical protein
MSGTGQIRPVIGQKVEIVYHPEPGHPLAKADGMTLVYAFNFWGTRSGTRLAVFENVLRPDSMRVKRALMEKTDIGWKATIDVPAWAAVLSWYYTDGVRRDDNNERTYTSLVYGTDGKPARNAHYFMTHFLDLARGSIAERVTESEQEVLLYPQNFKAYFQWFSLMFEQEKGGERVSKRIVEKLSSLERDNPDDQEVLNLCARTYYYILRETETGIEYKKKIGISNMWPEVVMIHDRERDAEAQRQAVQEQERKRTGLVDSPLPDVAFQDLDHQKRMVRADSGSVILLTFWATTSERSRKMLEILRAAVEKHGDGGLKVIAVNLDPDEQYARDYINENKLPFEHRLNFGGYLHELGIDSIPQTMVIDKNCMVRRLMIGLTDETASELESVLKEIL